MQEDSCWVSREAQEVSPQEAQSLLQLLGLVLLEEQLEQDIIKNSFTKNFRLNIIISFPIYHTCSQKAMKIRIFFSCKRKTTHADSPARVENFLERYIVEAISIKCLHFIESA